MEMVYTLLNRLLGQIVLNETQVYITCIKSLPLVRLEPLTPVLKVWRTPKRAITTLVS